MKLLSFLVSILGFLAVCKATTYEYNIKTFNVLLDHFTFADNATFPIRYLMNDSYVTDKRSPIMFYTGNEGDIELFAQNTGFVWKAGIQLKAMIVFAEHRYYGKSLPFGNESYKDPQHLGYLTSEQALADFADLLEHLNPDRLRPVICFGGSYGGMLSAWMRMKYPHLVVGALASSAPVRQFTDVVPCDIFNRILTSVFRVAIENSPCVDNIKKLWPVLKNFSSTEEGRKYLSNEFKFCKPYNKTEDYDTFYAYLMDVFGNLAMANYPYEANFLAPLPAFPVRQFCGQLDKNFDKNEELLTAFNNALQVYSNYTQKTKCLDISSAYDESMGSLGWDFQACTEMVMPMCTTGSTDMFVPKKWDFAEYSTDCFKKFKVYPRERAAICQYGAFKFDMLSNVIFSNGLLDPWSGGGVLRTQSDAVTVVILPEGAHHLDLREDNKADPASIKATRTYYLKTFREWVDTYNN
ncbi:hypothetical protein ACKWTF_016055 [Chironomus riparius]